MTTGTDKRRKPDRDEDEAIGYSVSSWIRIEIISILQEEPHNQTQICRKLGLSQSKLQHHIAELLKQKSIKELPGRRRGNIYEAEYVATGKQEFSAADFLEMDPATRRLITRNTLENALAEHLAALRAGEIRGADPHQALVWDWFDLDRQGRSEFIDEMEGSWKRLAEIRQRSNRRRRVSREPGETIVASVIIHPRVRPSPEEKAFRRMLNAEEVTAGNGPTSEN